ncbi:unnamed protein product, partial [Symbiodinium necroappetens]
MRFMFTEDELKQLDGLPGEDEEEDAAMSKPDIVNLDAKDVNGTVLFRKLLQWGKDSAERAVLQPSQVFEVFKETLGEDWICDSQAHICLLGRSEDSALVRHLYKVLTQDLTLRHISVASGGFEAVMKSATKHGYEIVRSEPGIAGALDRQPVPAAAAAAEGAAAAAAAAAETAASKLSAVLSSLKRVTAGPRPASEQSLAKSDAS